MNFFFSKMYDNTILKTCHNSRGIGVNGQNMQFVNMDAYIFGKYDNLSRSVSLLSAATSS